MEIYNLSLNAVLLNIKDDCTSFFCPRDCRFIKTLSSDLKVDVSPYELPYQRNTICPGKVYNGSPIKRLPMVYVHDTEIYYDITLLSINDKFVQVVIIKHIDCPDIIDVERDYDPYKLFYEYVGSISDLKARMSYESRFVQTVEKLSTDSAVTFEDAFKRCVDQYIIGSQFE